MRILGVSISTALLFSIVAAYSNASIAQQSACLDGICIGQDIYELDVDWKPVEVNIATEQHFRSLLNKQTVQSLYTEYNELLLAEESILQSLLPYVIEKQQFDASVLSQLKKVKQFCSSTSLVGEINNESRDRLLVTFRVVPTDSGELSFRVIQLEKQYNIFPPYLRPGDENHLKAKKKELKAQFPQLVEVRDIDARSRSNEVAMASALLGFKFYSDVSVPLTLRVKDTSEYELLEFLSEVPEGCEVFDV